MRKKAARTSTKSSASKGGGNTSETTVRDDAVHVQKKRQKTAYVSIGPYIRLYSEDYFIEALAPFGMTRKGFRCLCKALQVPMLEIGKTWLVDQFSLAIAMRGILRIGRPNFHAPGSWSVQVGKKYGTRKIDIDWFSQNMKTLLMEMLTVRRLAEEKAPSAPLKEAVSQAVQRMVLAGYATRSLEERDRVTARAVQLATLRGILDESDEPDDQPESQPAPPHGRGRTASRGEGDHVVLRPQGGSVGDRVGAVHSGGDGPTDH